MLTSFPAGLYRPPSFTTRNPTLDLDLYDLGFQSQTSEGHDPYAYKTSSKRSVEECKQTNGRAHPTDCFSFLVNVVGEDNDITIRSASSLTIFRQKLILFRQSYSDVIL